MRTIVIDGRQYDWKEIRQLRREQIQAARKPQLTLFELKGRSTCLTEEC